jgi:hypothetical protein
MGSTAGGLGLRLQIQSVKGGFGGFRRSGGDKKGHFWCTGRTTLAVGGFLQIGL